MVVLMVVVVGVVAVVEVSGLAVLYDVVVGYVYAGGTIVVLFDGISSHGTSSQTSSSHSKQLLG